jgi:hypothetical protein
LAEWHLDELTHRLAQRGWEVHESRESLRWGHSGSWEIVRGDERHVIDFYGGDGHGVDTYPIEGAYACRLRDRPTISLYFARRGSSWAGKFDAFVAALDGKS